MPTLSLGRTTTELLPHRRAVAVAVGPAVAWAVWASGPGALTPALVVLAAAGAALWVIDARTHRLPDAITAPATTLTAALLLLAAAATGDWAAAGRAALGGAGLLAAYLLLHLMNRRGLGLGDVKLAASLGAVAAWSGWDALMLAAAAPFLLGGLVALALIAARRAGRDTAIPFGPFMLAGTGLALTLARLGA
ncbi:A24 family peptidase [Antribacter sp. KLBMP9083]|uniref:A24 family peptidase n=1 Tax=Antribacter soli TaxID=2910976 RepID=A0AA41QH45_9MICO|nr:A24 family peptidase [Antribacter soli]MCF4122690.1 A24 family peptidase [Antribacter soli]